MLIIGTMLLTGYSDVLSPVTWGWLSMGGYGFQFALAANFLMLILWPFIKLRYVFIPLVGMLLCYSPTNKFWPMHRSIEPDGECLRVLSFNTNSMGYDSTLTTHEQRMERTYEFYTYFKETGADIVCLQETTLDSFKIQEYEKRLRQQLGYMDTVRYRSKDGGLILFSHFPIKKHEILVRDSDRVIATAFTINKDGKDMIIINAHLQISNISPEERVHFKDVTDGNHGRRAIARESKFMVTKLAESAKQRAPQAESIASYIRMHRHVPIILCGDFNDIPISYTHRTIAAELTDCYTEAGWGPGFSYTNNNMYVRIDNIMCSSHFKPLSCHVDNSFPYSDHYPIFATLSFLE